MANIEMTEYQAVSTTNDDEKPPSYFNIFPALKELKESDSNPLAKLKVFSAILCGSCKILLSYFV